MRACELRRCYTSGESCFSRNRTLERLSHDRKSSLPWVGSLATSLPSFRCRLSFPRTGAVSHRSQPRATSAHNA